jgi:hypothetical protein
MASTTKKSSDLGVILMGVIGVVLYGVITLVVVEQAGGTKIEPGYSNTPNAVTSSPPDFK